MTSVYHLTLMTRPLDPAERYFLALGRVWPRQITGIADLDRSFDADRVADAWAAIAARRALPQTRIVDVDTKAPRFVRVPGSAFTLHDGGDVLDAEQRVPFDLEGDPLVRLRFAPDLSRVALSAHHAVADARSVTVLLQELFAELDGRSSSADADEYLPPGMYECLPEGHRWTEDRRGMIALLHELREEQTGAAVPSAWPSHDRAAGETDLGTSTLTADVAPLTDVARAWGASVHGVLSAAVVAAAHHAEPALDQVALLTPVDLRPQLVGVSPSQLGLYISMLTTAHAVSSPGAETAAQASAELRRRVARGDGELTFLLTRPVAIEQEIAAAPQSIVVSNLGVVDAAADPDWVRSLAFTFGASPNQVAFLGFATYRDRVHVAVSVDRAKLAQDAEERFMQALSRILDQPAEWLGA
jgi:hypothetical protein